MGIEIELENVPENTPDIPFWIRDQDNSLKIKGAEFRLPVFSNSAKKALNLLLDALPTATITKRCSTHVHVDIHDFTISNLQTLILLYLIYEKSLYNYSGNRWNSNYCVPLRTFLTTNLLKASFNTLKINCTKYAGLHLFANNEYTTAEFRQMKGNKDSEDINNWIMLLVNLVNYSKYADITEIIYEIDTMHTTSKYIVLTEMIFKNKSNLILNQTTFKEDVEEGIRYVKLLIGVS